MFIKSDSWESRNPSAMKMLSTLLGCAPGSVLLQARLPLARFCHLKSHCYTNVSLQILITKLLEKFKMKKKKKKANFKVIFSLQVLKGNNFLCPTQFANIFIQNVLFLSFSIPSFISFLSLHISFPNLSMLLSKGRNMRRKNMQKT